MKIKLFVSIVFMILGTSIIFSQEKIELKVKLINGIPVKKSSYTLTFDNIISIPESRKDELNLSVEDVVKIKRKKKNFYVKSNFNFIVNDSTVYSNRKDKKMLSTQLISKCVHFIERLPQEEARERFGDAVTYDALLISFEK